MPGGSRVEVFTSRNCPRCRLLKSFLESRGLEFVERRIDEDPEAEVDALMLNIFEVPALVVRGSDGARVLTASEMFGPFLELRREVVEEWLEKCLR